MNCRLKPRNQEKEIRNGSWVHSSRSLFRDLPAEWFLPFVARAKEGKKGTAGLGKEERDLSAPVKDVPVEKEGADR